MSGRIRYRRWSQWLTLAISAIVFLIGWWVEGYYLKPPQRQHPTGQITSGEYQVQYVIDGDTLILEQDNLRIRLQGIDTPETVKEGSAVEPWGPEATTYTKQFITNANWRVRLAIEGEALDRYGRHLAFVWHNGRLLNEELVRNGLARARTQYEFSEPLKQRLRQAQLEAQQAQRGIWSNLQGSSPPF